jgi:hypothetical protein
MAITYEEAVARLTEWTDNPALVNHARGWRRRCGARRIATAPARPTSRDG